MSDLYDDNDDFEVEDFQESMQTHWKHFSPCSRTHFCIYKRDDDVWQIEVAPIFQEVYGGNDDGKKVWTAFEFNLFGFLVEPGVDVEECGVMSYFHERNSPPHMEFRGKYCGKPFELRLHLEPMPNSEPSEMIDTITGQVRSILGEP